MSLIDYFDGEQKRIYSWACESDGTDYLQQDWKEDKNSYFEHFDNAQNIHVYGFDSLRDLINQLDDLWKDEKCMKEILRVCAVSAYRNKPERQTKQSDSGVESMEIPEFVYVF